MSKVLLLIPPDPNTIEPFKSAPVRQFPMGVGFPMGIACIGAYLRRHGYEVQLYDALQRKATIEDILSLIQVYQPCYVGMTTFTVNIKVAVELARQIKARFPHIITLAGGPHASEDWENLCYNYPWFDYIVRGEGETITEWLLDALEHGESVGRVIGPYNELNLDDLPLPARDLLNLDAYITKESTLPYQVVVQSSRGCTHRCLFCSFQKKWRARSAASVVAEIKHLVATYPRMKSISFMDDDFSASKCRVLEICLALKEAGISLPWSCSCRVDQMDAEMLRCMKDAGCVKILYGLEAADEQLLKTLRKRISLPQVRQVVDMTSEIGIDCIVFVIAGNPGETIATLKGTANFVKSLNCEAVALGVMQVYPGTGLAKLLPPYDFVSYVYEPEIANPSAAIHSCIRTFENPGLDREALKRWQRKLARDIIIHKMLRHPVYALKKLWRMPMTAVQNFLWLLNLKREPQ